MSDRLPIEDRAAETLALYPPLVRRLLLDILRDEDPAAHARSMGQLYADERSRSLAELLIDIEVDPYARAFIVGMLLGDTTLPE
jgi:hypothetical protein